MPERRTTTDADALYRSLVATATRADKKQNLARVWDALEGLRRDAERRRTPAAYTTASVLRWLKEAGRPMGESTIRNKPQGDDYQLLIATYAAQHGARPAPAATDDALVLRIADPAVQASVRTVIHQNRALRASNDILLKQMQRLASEAPRDHASTSAPAALPAGATAASALGQAPDPREAIAVRQFLERLPQHLWTVDEPTGAILDRFANEVAPPGFVHALRRLAAG